MTSLFSRRRMFPLLALPFAAACAAPDQSAAPAAPTSGPSGATGGTTTGTAVAAQPTAAAPAAPSAAPAGALTFKIAEGESEATFRVREQLANVQLPNDAVGTTTAVSGQLSLRPDGSPVTDASKITVDLRQLKTDSTMRDNFIKQNTLQTSRFPFAEFVPTRVEGLPSPLPASGEHAFKLTGLMTVHGIQKEVTWDVTANRSGTELEGTATTAVKFGDFGMSPPRVPVVLSIVDEIRLELDLVASLTA
jgi:polyisoprenoid-binding protein YceI